MLRLLKITETLCLRWKLISADFRYAITLGLQCVHDSRRIEAQIIKKMFGTRNNGTFCSNLHSCKCNCCYSSSTRSKKSWLWGEFNANTRDQRVSVYRFPLWSTTSNEHFNQSSTKKYLTPWKWGVAPYAGKPNPGQHILETVALVSFLARMNIWHVRLCYMDSLYTNYSTVTVNLPYSWKVSSSQSTE